MLPSCHGHLISWLGQLRTAPLCCSPAAKPTNCSQPAGMFRFGWNIKNGLLFSFIVRFLGCTWQMDQVQLHQKSDLLPRECYHPAVCTEDAHFPVPEQEKTRCQILSQYTCQSLGRSANRESKFLWKLSQRSTASSSPRTINLEKQNLLKKTRGNGYIQLL